MTRNEILAALALNILAGLLVIVFFQSGTEWLRGKLFSWGLSINKSLESAYYGRSRHAVSQTQASSSLALLVHWSFYL